MEQKYLRAAKDLNKNNVTTFLLLRPRTRPIQQAHLQAQCSLSDLAPAWDASLYPYRAQSPRIADMSLTIFICAHKSEV